MTVIKTLFSKLFSSRKALLTFALLLFWSFCLLKHVMSDSVYQVLVLGTVVPWLLGQSHVDATQARFGGDGNASP